MLMHEFVVWAALMLATTAIVMISAKKIGVEIIIGVYAVLSVIANIVAVKLISVGGIIAPAGVIVYSVTFLLTDFLSEIYGKGVAGKAVATGFIANIIYLIVISVVLLWSPAPFMPPEFIDSFNAVFNLAPRIVLASLIAFVISQTNDVYVFHYIRQKTGRRHLWIRNNVSTAISQFIDTAIFITIAFYGVAPVLELIAGQYVLKLIIALLDTPFLYITVKAMGFSSEKH
ncbi:queuosine precursor transporter [Geoglobus acetivorans]|uniref:Probable queuosine precursor transporter n=1 Tax=Geoglobus acetivorans TaxID=565033 RepID=A0A0A7GCB6_GEOAI|nr:Transporter [Geoglobus acetivorans]